ncbi:nucleoside hydrolase-like domain-containing protein [Streptococcus dentiloxodontae]
MKWKTFISLSFIAVVVLIMTACSKQGNHNTKNKQTSDKYRTVITTDGEVDDMNSMIRTLYYANEMDIEGIVLTSSTYHYAGDEKKDIAPYRWTGTDWIYNMLDAYEKVQPNLTKHAEGFPTADDLRKVTKVGNISNVGEMDEVTEGSEFLKNLFLDDDDRPLYVQTWGGTNTTARALKSIEEQYKDTDDWKKIQQKIYDKLVLYIILDQDDSYANYIATNWPNITVINDQSNFWYFAYMWQKNDEALTKTLKADWQKENILEGHGPLLDMYASMGDGNIIDGELAEEQRGSSDYLANNPTYQQYDFISEGDSPSYFYLFQNGLNNVDHPEYGGWGGRFGQISDKLYQNTQLDYNPYTKQFESQYTLTRWIDDINNDFAARADWGIASDYDDANHKPEASVVEGTTLSAKAGEKVSLTAKGDDPDGDKLTYSWWRYFEADSYKEYKGTSTATESIDPKEGLSLGWTRKLDDGEVVDPVSLTGANSKTVSFTIPKDAKSGDTFHMILEVTDNGAHHLKAYQRVIISVK